MTDAFPHDGPAALWSGWFAAASRPDVHQAITATLHAVERSVADRAPRCDLSGRCCDFDRFQGGHRLYVTGLELAWTLLQPVRISAHAAPMRLIDQPRATPHDGACPFQKNRLCTVHTIRPIGCRLFFCDPAAESWQQTMYAHFLAEIRRPHDRHAVAYRYIEWRAGLREAWAHRDAAPSSSSVTTSEG